MRRPKNTTLRKRSSMDERAGVKVKHRALELREKCDMSSGWGVEERSRQHVRVLQTGRRHLIGAGPCGVGGDRCMRCRGVHGDPYLSHRAWAKHLESSATPSAISHHHASRALHPDIPTPPRRHHVVSRGKPHARLCAVLRHGECWTACMTSQLTGAERHCLCSESPYPQYLSN
jgi:hypothetical protein